MTDGALRRVGLVGDGVGALAASTPSARPVCAAGLAGDQRDPVGDHEAGVEADAELADQLGRRLLRRPPASRAWRSLRQHLGGAGLGDRADEVDDLVAAHPDAVVADGQGALGRVGLEGDVQVGGVDLEVLVLVGGQPQLVQRVGGVGDQLPEEDVLGRVDRVDHQLQQLTGLGLELDRLGGHRRKVSAAAGACLLACIAIRDYGGNDVRDSPVRAPRPAARDRADHARSAALRRSALDSLAIDAAIRTQRAENAARTLTVPMSAARGQRHAAAVHPRPAARRGHDAGPGRAGRRPGPRWTTPR